MTAQMGDTIIIDGEEKEIMGYLHIPSNMLRFARGGDSFSSSTACWRGYVGAWEVRDAVVYLKEVAGCFRMASKEPVKASWLNHEFVRIIDGDVAEYVHMGFESKYDAVLELELSFGVIIRQRRVTAPQRDGCGFSPYTPTWRYLPEASVLFPPECHIATSYQKPPDPTKDGPQYSHFRGRCLRPRITAERTARGLNYGGLVRLAGYSGNRGWGLAEWERGRKGIDAEMEEKICAELGIPKDEWMACHQKDYTDFQVAWDAWADEPIIPMLKIQDTLNSFWYAAPFEYRNDPDRLVAWAKACYDLTWRKPVLIISRRKTIRLISLDVTAEKIRECPKAPKKVKVSPGTAAHNHGQALQRRIQTLRQQIIGYDA